MSLPTNRQQIMRRAAARGHPVLFVETGGFIGKHLLGLLRGRQRGSLLRRFFVGEQPVPSVTVRKAFNVLPWGQRYSLCNRLNGALNVRLVRRAARALPAPRIAWLYDPTATWAIGSLHDHFAVYDCVDDYREQASGRRNRRLVGAGDATAARRSRLVFTTATPLYERHRVTNPHTHLVRNVGDYNHFAPAADPGLGRADLRALTHPVIGFAGNFLASKVDIGLVEELAERLAPSTLVLAGPAMAHEMRERVEALATRTNVLWLGPVPYSELPTVVATFDVCIIPYLENEYTRSCFPLKLFEYLAAGKPVVASGLPELRGLEPDVEVVAGTSSFVAAIKAASTISAKDDVERRRAIARANTWDARTSRLLELVSAAIGS